MNTRTRVLGLAAGLAVVLAVGGVEPVSARNRKEIESGTAEVTLRVYDYVHMDSPALVAAEGEATAILRQAGIESRWVDCPTSEAEIANFPDCKPEFTAADFVIRVLPDRMVNSVVEWQEALGSTPACVPVGTCISNIFYDRVHQLAVGANATLPVLMGRAMAHEIGHLLLGPHAHRGGGIMRPFWSGRDLSLDGRIYMLFTPDQSWQMKTRLAARAQAWQAEEKVAKLGRR